MDHQDKSYHLYHITKLRLTKKHLARRIENYFHLFLLVPSNNYKYALNCAFHPVIQNMSLSHMFIQKFISYQHIKSNLLPRSTIKLVVTRGKKKISSNIYHTKSVQQLSRAKTYTPKAKTKKRANTHTYTLKAAIIHTERCKGKK